MLNNIGFDNWAFNYDENLKLNKNKFPFEGYENILHNICKSINKIKGSSILDFGIGTGILTHIFYQEGASILGIDFSKNMIDIAKKKMPKAKFIQWDFKLGIPEAIDHSKFDYIIFSYSIHHLDDNEKIELINSLTNILKKNGKIIIGDIAFENKNDMIKCKHENIDNWDENEFYIIADIFINKLINKNKNITANYNQISSYTGILEIFT